MHFSQENQPKLPANLRQYARVALAEPDPAQKVAGAQQLFALLTGTNHENLEFSKPSGSPLQPAIPGRPPLPALRHPAKMPRRQPSTLEGRAALVHSIAHIEFNAINLALDAVWRFDGMPDGFYADWTTVAKEEAHHFTLLREHLRSMGKSADGSPRWDYGSFAAHDGLWEMCDKTAHDAVARMALVPRTLEARGLDATPQIQAKLRQVNTPDALGAVEILDIILRDEIGHVAIGNHWYRWLCARDGLEPIAHYQLLAALYRAPQLKPPFNKAARTAAGFTAVELDLLG